MREAGASAWRRRAAGLALAFVSLAPAAAGGLGTDDDPQQLLVRAFQRRYACSITGVVRIATRKGEAEARERRLHVAAKFVKGKLHTYAIFREPQYVRGMAFLGVESDDPRQSEQQFVYLPSRAKVRRVSGSQPSDSFLGTDLSYNDFQRQHAERYRATRATPGTIDGEPIETLSVLPLFEAPYSNVDFEVALADGVILGTHYYKRAD